MPRPRDAAWQALILVAAIAIGAMTLARPAVPGSPAADEFDAQRALEHVAVIAEAPHPMGSPENAAVREYLVAELSTLGLSPELQVVPAPDYFGAPGRTIDVVNVMARIPGVASTGTVLLMAHYDTMPTTPGANDNSTAVASLLESGRALLAGQRLANDVVLLFTDGEEPAPRYGSAAFVAEHPWMDEVVFAMNFEAFGESGPSVLAQTGEAQAWTIDRVATGVERPVAFSFFTATVELLADIVGEIGTDFDPFLAAGAEGILVAYQRGSSIYHTPRDNLAGVSERSMQHHGDYAMGLTQELGDLDLSELPPSGRATFFTVFPGVLLRYPQAWTLPLALLAAVVAMAAELRRSRLRTVLGRAGLTLLGALGLAVAATLIWMGLAAMRPEMGAVEAYVSAVTLLAAGIAVRRWWTSRRSSAAASVGGVTLWALLAVATAIGLPGAAYLFTWPALAAGVALLAWPTVMGATAQRLRLAIVAVVMAVMVVPALDVFLAMAQPRPGNADSGLTGTFLLFALLSLLAADLVGRFVAADGNRPPTAEQPLDSDAGASPGQRVAASSP